MKHIVIDARLYGPKHTGIGRYSQNLLIALDKLISNRTDIKFTLITYPALVDQAVHDLPHFNVIGSSIPHYSLIEQFKLPFILYSLQPDLVHFTHFNKPLLYFGESVVTIHDLIMNFFKGRDTTTRPSLFYWPKYWAYRLLVFIVIHSSKIIVPSNFWRDYLLKSYKINPSDIITTYEAVDPKLFSHSLKIDNSKIENYILYTGNLYPHKNIKVVLEALKMLPDIKLKVICARSDVFTKRFTDMVARYQLQSQVELLGYIPDEDFNNLYSQALALVHPSFMEGFSLTGLEAMALNCPVISSNASCLPEIYQDSVLYFDPNDAKNLAAQVTKLKNNAKLRQELIDKGCQQVSKYSWDKTARQTLAYYLKILELKN